MISRAQTTNKARFHYNNLYHMSEEVARHGLVATTCGATLTAILRFSPW